MRWAVYYGDGRRFTDSDGSPADAPAWDVQVIAQESDRVGRILIEQFEGKDYYVFRDGEWYVCDYTGLIDSLAHFPGCIVRFGRTRSDGNYAAARQRALNDDYFPRKSGRDGRREQS